MVWTETTLTFLLHHDSESRQANALVTMPYELFWFTLLLYGKELYVDAYLDSRTCFADRENSIFCDHRITLKPFKNIFTEHPKVVLKHTYRTT